MNPPIPIVDVEKIGVQRETSQITRKILETLAEELKHSLCKYGACYFTNHGIQYEAKFMKLFENFFIQPLEIKEEHLRGTRRDFGYTPIGKEKPNIERPGDFREAFNYQPGDDPNDWICNEFPSACMEMFNQCSIFGYRVLDAISLALGQSQTFLRDKHTKIGTSKNLSTLRALYYPPVTTESLLPGQIRLGEHSDCGTISFIFQDEVGGLEIEDKDTKGFIPATPIPGSLLILANDLLQRWTADNVASLVHRILIPVEEEKRRKPRQSAVFFILPDNDCLIKPIDGSLKYKPISCIEYVQEIISPVAGVKL